MMNAELEVLLLRQVWTLAEDSSYVTAFPQAVCLTIKREELNRISLLHKISPNIVVGG